MPRWLVAAAFVAALALVYCALKPGEKPVVNPYPDCRPGPARPEPDKQPPVCPCPRCPSCPVRDRVIGQTPTSEPAVDLLAMPASVRPHNTGGTDGSGLCVFTSIQYAAHWQNEPRLKDFQAKMRRELGGGWPEKVDKMITKYGAGTRYIQYQGRDPAVIELALKTGRVPCITWQSNHMLSCVHLDQERAAIVDNNSPNRVQWFPRSTFLSKWSAGGGGWVVVLLNPGPPPPPRSSISPRAVRMCRCSADCPECHGQGCGVVCHCPPGRSLEAFHRPVWVWAQLPQPTIQPRQPLPVPDARAGVRWTAPGDTRWEMDGRASSLEEVTESLSDDSGKLHLTVIGGKEERAKTLADLSDVRARYSVQEYEPGAWELQCGFASPAKPGMTCVYLQGRDGKVLLRKDGYGSAEELRGALRRADPGYNPATDPSGASSIPGGQVVVWAKDNAVLLIVLAGAVVAGWLVIAGRLPGSSQGRSVSPRPQPSPENDLDALYRELGRRHFERHLRESLGGKTDNPDLSGGN